MDIAEQENLKVIEDCAHAVETEYHGQTAETFGDIGCSSFCVTKNIVTGEGGMAITNNAEYASVERKNVQDRFEDKYKMRFFFAQRT